MPPRRFLDGASLGRDGSFIGLTLLPRAIVDLPRDVRDLRPICTDSALGWFGVWIHTASLRCFGRTKTLQARRGRTLPRRGGFGLGRNPAHRVASCTSAAALIRTLTHASLGAVPPKYFSHSACAFSRRRRNLLSSARSNPASISIRAASSWMLILSYRTSRIQAERLPAVNG
jgi:hypothetical protein